LNWIDEKYAADSKAVLRYAPYLFSDLVSEDSLIQASQSEGFRMLELHPYKGVQLFVMDESTKMQTGTYKSLDGCLTTAICKQDGETRIAFSSGANAGIAWTQYGSRIGIETFFFCPPTTLYKIRGELFDNKQTHLICVGGTDREVKKAVNIFGEMTKVRVVPQIEWRFLSAGVRGMYLAEQMKMRNGAFNWFAQAICAGFGPIGIYRTLCQMTQAGTIPNSWICGFLGVQQSALSPIVTAWKNRESQLSTPGAWGQLKAIEPGLYNTHPSETYESLADILSFTNGDMVDVEYQEYEHFKTEYVGRLEEAGIRLTIRPETSDYLEKAGVLAGAGVIKAIHRGIITSGQTVVCSLSGGTAPAPCRPAVPEFTIDADADLAYELTRYVMERNLLARS
jgi:threonine synthase